MSEENAEKYYGVEGDDERRPSSVQPGVTGKASDGNGSDPEAPRGVRALDVCPNCGEPLSARDTLVCMHCGFDLKTNRVIEIAVGETEIEPTDTTGGSQALAALCRPGMGGLWMAEAVMAVCGAALLVGHLAGMPGLFSNAQMVTAEGATVASIPFGTRLNEVLRWLVLSGLWTGCGVGALYVLAGLHQMRFGDLGLAAARMGAIVLAMGLVTFINLQQTVEWIVERVLQLGVFAGLAIVMFRLKPRDALTLTGIALLGFMTLWLGSYLVVWVTAGG